MALNQPKQVKQSLNKTVLKLYAAIQTELVPEGVNKHATLQFEIGYKESKHAPPSIRAEIEQEGVTMETVQPLKRVMKELEKEAEQAEPEDPKEALKENLVPETSSGSEQGSSESVEVNESSTPDIESIIKK